MPDAGDRRAEAGAAVTATAPLRGHDPAAPVIAREAFSAVLRDDARIVYRRAR